MLLLMKQLLNQAVSQLLQLSLRWWGQTGLIWPSADSSLLLLSRLSCPDSDSLGSVTRPGEKKKVTSFIFSAFLGSTEHRWNGRISTFHPFDPTGGKAGGVGRRLLHILGTTVEPWPQSLLLSEDVVEAKSSSPEMTKSRAWRQLIGWRFRAQQRCAFDTTEPPVSRKEKEHSVAHLPGSRRPWKRNIWRVCRNVYSGINKVWRVKPGLFKLFKISEVTHSSDLHTLRRNICFNFEKPNKTKSSSLSFQLF